jgi:hypothetical protein
MNCPDDYDVDGCCHQGISDEDLEKFQVDLPGEYVQNLQCLLAASTQANYKIQHLAVGLCKQTIFSGLPSHPLAVPSLFTMDIMHLSVLNEPDLFFKLFTGKINIYQPDNRADWDWAIFYPKPALWSAHGETIPRSVPFIPSSFGCAP